MKKLAKWVLICLSLAALVWGSAVVRDRQKLGGDLIRLHVVANSDGEGDQRIKLQVRDAVTESLEQTMAQITDVKQAKAYLEENLPKLEALANRTLERLGSGDKAAVSLQKEAFDTRIYDTFSLPAGVYESLRIVIGDGEGENWWCVVFPELCIPATVGGFEETAVECGFSDALTDTLTGEDGYEIRFFLLDCLGRIENFFFDR